ncbi:MAG: Tn3 family transposase, partial [Cyanobacteria bacterium P01_F01_bin.86]
QLRSHPAPIRYTLVAAFCYQRLQEITDNLVELLVQIVHRLSINAERRVEREFLEDFKRVYGKEAILYRIAQAALAHPDKAVKEVIYPIASPAKLQALIQERESTGTTYREKVYTRIRSSYLHYYRRMVPPLLDALEFKSNNETHQPVIQALTLLKRYQGNPNRYFDANEKVIITGVLTGVQQDLVVEKDAEGKERINRVNYEICVLQALREKLRSREVWVEGAKQFGNPEQDLPSTPWREYPYHFSSLQSLPLVSPFERLGHRVVEIGNEI